MGFTNDVDSVCSSEYWVPSLIAAPAVVLTWMIGEQF